jgi:antagonist of KipI
MALVVVRPGMLTTVQDLGRWGHQHWGVPVAGPMDWYSHRLANEMVGNSAAAAALEITLVGPELEASEETTCVVQGARFDATVNGEPVELHHPVVIPAAHRLRFGTRRSGARATLAVAGGLVSGIGPFGGRAVQAGDVLEVNRVPRAAFTGAVPSLDVPSGGARVRAMRGPHDAMFTPGALELLFSARFTVTPQSNRMGYRLEGPPLLHAGSGDILSDATPIGSLHVPASGQLILLMADRQTTGGYPKIATVITADLPLAGQLAPGDWIEFEKCTRAEAVIALREQDARLRLPA